MISDCVKASKQNGIEWPDLYPNRPDGQEQGFLGSVMSSIKKKSPQPPGMGAGAGASPSGQHKVAPQDYPQQQQNNSFRKQPVE